MRVGIICAGDREAAPFLPVIDECEMSEKAMLKFHSGKIADVEVVVLFSGVCKVNAAIAAQILIDTYHTDIIINAGTAGGIDPQLDIFDTVISTETAYHDVAPHILTEFHPWLDSVFFKADQKLLKLAQRVAEKYEPDRKIYFGRMATGEAFISDEGREDIIERLASLTVDMESASIAHVCYVNGIPFISIRCITDDAKHSGTGFFEINCDKASAIAKDITVDLLSEIHQMHKNTCFKHLEC